MNIQYFRTEIETLENRIKEKQLQFEDERRSDLLFEQIKRLYVEMKELNQRLEKFLHVSNLELHQ